MAEETPLKGLLLSCALLALAVDLIASLALSGRLRGPRAANAALVVTLAAALGLAAPVAEAQQDDSFAITATSEVETEEHSELQSPVPISYAVFCLKKKKQNK